MNYTTYVIINHRVYERGDDMRKLYLVLILTIVVLFSGCKQSNNDTIIMDDYDMSVVYIEDSQSLNVSGTLLHLNKRDNVDELYVSIYPNSSYEGPHNNLTIHSLEVEGDDANYTQEGNDGTVFHITLDKTYSKNELIEIEFDYTFVFNDSPNFYADESSLYALFFYPFVAMYDETGWNIDEYSYRGESYYNDLANYDVTIIVPEDYVIASGGKLESSKISRGNKEERYVINDARDYSFSASKNYIVYEREIDEITHKIVSMETLSNNEQDTYFQILEDSFRVYTTYVGEYYYDYFTLELGYIYGMESSSIIYCSSDVQEGTIVHEVVHQWFFFMIGNDQYDESFLDESLTTFASSLYYYDLYGMEGYNTALDYRDSRQERLLERWNDYYGESLLRNTDEMGEGYAMLIYYQGPSMFRYYIDEYLNGDVEAFFDIMKTYYDRYQGDIASVEEFLTLLEEESGVDGTKEWFYFHLDGMQELENKPE